MGSSHQAQYGIYTLSFNWSKNCKFIAILTKREDGCVFTHGGGGFTYNYKQLRFTGRKKSMRNIAQF